MKRLIALLMLSIFAPAFAADVTNATVKLPAKEKFDLYLLIGQSNMAGRGKVEAQDKVPHPRVFKFTKENQWQPAVDPLHFDKTVAGVGLGSSFGRAMADNDPSVTIGLIPCAVGGTPLVRWQKDGDLYKQAVERAKLAMKDGTIKGILWHQGEADSGQEENAKTYGTRLAKMIQDLRHELGNDDIPVVVGKLGEFLYVRADTKPYFGKLVNEQLTDISKLAPKTACADSAGLKDKGDGVHFDAPSLRTFGKRYAEKMLELQSKAKAK